RRSHVEQNRVEFITVSRLPQTPHGLVEFFGHHTPALTSGIGKGRAQASAKGRGDARFHLGFDLLLQILDQARTIFFTNSPPSGGRRGGRHAKLSIRILTERKQPNALGRAKSSDRRASLSLDPKRAWLPARSAARGWLTRSVTPRGHSSKVLERPRKHFGASPLTVAARPALRNARRAGHLI